MALFTSGDRVPQTGYYQCIFCRSVILCQQGDQFPECLAGCKSPAYAYTRKERRATG